MGGLAAPLSPCYYQNVLQLKTEQHWETLLQVTPRDLLFCRIQHGLPEVSLSTHSNQMHSLLSPRGRGRTRTPCPFLILSLLLYLFQESPDWARPVGPSAVLPPSWGLFSPSVGGEQPHPWFPEQALYVLSKHRLHSPSAVVISSPP